MFKLFSKFASVGLINTAIHWLIFYALLEWVHWQQADSNLLAFIAASSFSFFANARFTFKAKTSLPRYLSFTGFMGAMSYALGALGDALALLPLLTLIMFSLVSLVCGFLYSHFIVFKSSEL